MHKRGRRIAPATPSDDAASPRRALMLTDKKALRARMRAARDAFVASGARAILAPPELLKRLERGLTVTSYVPVGSEADPAILAQAAVTAGCVIALPHVTVRSEPMRFLEWETEAALEAGPFGLSQPAADAADLRPDIILTPLLAFDAKLDRLGQGAGYYDRAFARFPDALRVGVAWSVQQVEDLPVDRWDVPLHAIVTEKGWISQ
jgi:5-formyltetrahydrofolate cyclo-ligase